MMLDLVADMYLYWKKTGWHLSFSNRRATVLHLRNERTKKAFMDKQYNRVYVHTFRVTCLAFTSDVRTAGQGGRNPQMVNYSYPTSYSNNKPSLKSCWFFFHLINKIKWYDIFIFEKWIFKNHYFTWTLR